MRKLGYTSALHLVTINEHVRRLIPQDSPYVCSNTKESSYPHLIVQFGKEYLRESRRYRHLHQPGQSHYLSSMIDDNIVMKLNEDFADLITDAKDLSDFRL